jgi:threonine synthase
MVSDKQILAAYRMLAEYEGVFAEPASAASIAGLLKLVKKGYFASSIQHRRIRIVCILTGHGLKDPERAIKTIKPPKLMRADLKAIVKEIGY